MAIIRATVSMADNSGLGENRVVNVWHFVDSTGVLGTSAATALATFVPTFYSTAGVGSVYSGNISRAALVHRISIAQLDVGSAGADDDVLDKVFLESSWTMSGTPSDVPLPSEVAVALSFRGDIDGIPEESGVTRPASRRRGRVFLGPFTTGIMAIDAGSRTFPSASFRNNVLSAYQAMVASLKTVSPPLVHSVYSPTSGQTFPVTVVSIDDAFDTMRSRGQAATSRISQVVP